MLLAVGSPADCQEARLLDFDLEDQFGNAHRRSDVADSIVLLIGSDKDGSEFNEAWGKAIHGALGDHPRYREISHLALADLRGVPFFLKRMIRGMFPENEDRWVLMDWKGTFAKAYDFAPKSSNVLVFAPDGTLAHHAMGREPGDDTLEGIETALRALLGRVE